MNMPQITSLVAGLLACVAAGESRPNILFCLSDGRVVDPGQSNGLSSVPSSRSMIEMKRESFVICR